MDNSTTDYKNSGPDVPYMVVNVVTFLLGIVGNGLFIVFGIFRMKKTVSLVWFLNLALSDFTFAFFIPLEITYYALGHWPFGSFMCKLSVFFYIFNMSVSGLQLTVLSVDRCMCVAFPQWCHNQRTRRWALIIVLIIWILSSASSLPFSIFSDVSDYDFLGYCRLNYYYGIYFHFIIRFVYFFLVPFLVTVCSYIGITLYSLIKLVPVCSRTFTVSLAVSIVFLVIYSPLYVISILRTLKVVRNYNYIEKVEEIVAYMRVIGSCINPIIYVLVGWKIKGNFCRSFQAMLEVFAEDDEYIGLNNREDRTVSLNLEEFPVRTASVHLSC